MNYKLLMFLTLAVLTVSCEKNDGDDNDNNGDTKTELITAASWKYENAGVDGDRNGSIDLPLPVTLPPCITDNFLTLLANGTGTVDEGLTKCDPLLPQTSPATWSFAANQTALNLGGSGLFGVSGQFKLLELSATKLHLSKDTTYLGIPVAVVIQLKH